MRGVGFEIRLVVAFTVALGIWLSVTDAFELARVEEDDDSAAVGDEGSIESAYEEGGPAFFAHRVTFVDKVV